MWGRRGNCDEGRWLAADFSGAEERRVERPPTLSMSSTDYSLSGQAGAVPCILALLEPCEADVSTWAWSSFLRKNYICWAWGTLAAWVRAHLAWALTPHSPSGPWRSFAPRHPLCAPGFLVQRLQQAWLSFTWKWAVDTMWL